MGRPERLREYLDGLPLGLDSFPAQQVQAMRPQAAVAVARTLGVDFVGLPPALSVLASATTAKDAWVPEVHFYALIAALVDAGKLSEEGYIRFSRDGVMQMLRNPLYRAQFHSSPAGELMERICASWGRFNRGTTLSWDGAVLHYGFPEGLINEFIADGLVAGWAQTVETASRSSKSMRLERFEEGELQMRIVELPPSP